ncbi:MAG TPA: hypothetical protein VJ907_08885, partial [Halanaerobiales bacterium]|nr:hypothetical protein [Halanaerobiales bacterium]
MYNTTKVTDYITLDKILKKVDELAIYNYYSDEVLSIGKPIKSPLRRDNNPSFALYVSKNGKIMWKDFSTGDSGDVIKFVKWKLHTDYKHALKYIWRDLIAEPIGKFNIVEYKRPNYVSRTEIGIKRKYFSKTDDNYWGQYGLDRRILKRYKVTPIHNFWINEVKQSFSYDEKSPMYAYRIFNKFKIYRPMSKTKKDKWRTNCNSYDIQGYEQLP